MKKHILRWLMRYLISHIPDGLYCTGCPFLDIDPDGEPQNNGYCHYMGWGDDSELANTLLWNGCKECCLNYGDLDD